MRFRVSLEFDNDVCTTFEAVGLVPRASRHQDLPVHPREYTGLYAFKVGVSIAVPYFEIVLN